MGDLSKNFNRSEFACPCCGKDDISLHLVVEIQRVRDMVNSPITVSSGVRCEKHNLEVGGGENSQHLLGKAADISAGGIPLGELHHKASIRFRDHGIGVYVGYDGFLHLDLRGNPARWGYINETSVGYNAAVAALEGDDDDWMA